MPPPTVTVFSGGGFQAFWALGEPTEDLHRVERLNAALAHQLGGDNCHNIDRIMRLPGTINVPNAKKRKAGRQPALAHVVKDLTNWTRRYDLSDFDEGRKSSPATTTQHHSGERPLVPLSLENLPPTVPDWLRGVVVAGDDARMPMGTPDARYPSRSEVVWHASCEMARAGCSLEQIAGILLNPAYGISASVLEKRKSEDYAARQARRALEWLGSSWPDVSKSGRPLSTLRNSILAMRRLEVRFAFNQFSYRKTVQGFAIQEYQGELSDDACAVLRHAIIEKFGFDPGKENSRESAQTLSVENPFHPIRTYLDSLEWDGAPRIGSWLTAYMGAEPTPLNCAIGRIVLIAAARRIRTPGAKFDSILVLEGPQGGGKSTAIKILAGPENFSDQEILTLDPKAQMEALEGVWLYEICELEGLSRADTAKVKAFASRSVDQGRPAYARFKEARPRQTVFVGTTNDDKYLRDATGNRRFWPVKVAAVDLDALARNRDQLWAEAADWEAKDETTVLAEELWPAAQSEQEARVEDDPWLDRLEELTIAQEDIVGDFARVATSNLLEIDLAITPDRQQPFHTKRLASVMRKLGWEGPRAFRDVGGDVFRGYQRRATGDSGQMLPWVKFKQAY